MNAVHPTLRQALADCLPPGFRQAPVMHAISIAESAHISRLEAQVSAQAAVIAALRTELRKVNAPPCPAGQFEHAYAHPELGELECHLEWEQAEPEAGWPEEITLMAAYLCGRDIADRLTKDEVERIQIAAGAQAKVPA